MKTKILLVDDEDDLNALFKQLFRRQIQTNQYGYEPGRVRFGKGSEFIIHLPVAS